MPAGNPDRVPQSIDPHLFEVNYDDLKRAARHLRRFGRPDPALSTTALLHDTFVELFGDRQDPRVVNAALLYLRAVMFNVLLQQARTGLAKKRGGGVKVDSLDQRDEFAQMWRPGHSNFDTVLIVRESLAWLDQHAPRAAQALQMFYMEDLTQQEIASVMGVSAESVKKYLSKGRDLLRSRLGIARK